MRATFFLVGLKFELRACTCEAGSQCLTHASSPFCSDYFLEMGFCKLFDLAGLEP
jgi:hypothetical protein